eukprot:gnl/TRDRNA2_/TRDRNA2_30771_c0_seq1.p1 gnl/TRDRNA2_/TRDRNA2_30771_c0~~gnl/TRDRNA2_/TRDRNA2_30771_c0_seq1.p1  ORF type:complete len:354 (-),score=68.75 gnl/TRDRNA2_/TRDRNA2_30771_c0_seq1:71-1132(-)
MLSNTAQVAVVPSSEQQLAHHVAASSLIRVPGSQLCLDYERMQKRRQVRNKNPSPFETCLTGKIGKNDSSPRMTGLDKVQESLERDMEEQTRKYRGSPTPNIDTARFHFQLPVGPQSDKYSKSRNQLLVSGQLAVTGGRHDRSESDSKESPSKTRRGGARFNIRTLKHWFQELDIKDTGSIQARDLLVSLRKRDDLQAMLCVAASVGDEESVEETKNASTAEEKTKARREEMKRIRGILASIDTDGSGSLEWEEFVDFFRRSGLLLEYETVRMKHMSKVKSVKVGKVEVQLDELTDVPSAPEISPKIQWRGRSAAVVGRHKSAYFVKMDADDDEEEDEDDLLQSLADTSLHIL